MALTYQPISESGLPADIVDAIKALHIFSVEDAVALLRIDEVKDLFIKRLNIDEPYFENLARDLEKRVGPQIAAEYLARVPEEHFQSWRFGCRSPGELPTPPPEQAQPDDPYSLQALRVSEINHIPHLQPVKSQGHRGTCVAFGTACMREFIENNAGPLSEQYLYWGAKMRDGSENEEGTWIKYAVRCLEEDGECRERYWGYCPEPGNTIHQGPPPPEARDDAPNFNIKKGEPVQPTSVNDLRRCLAGYDEIPGRVIAFAIPVFPSWYKNPITVRTGRIPMPLPDESHQGGHCMALVGFRDDDDWPGGGYFILRNSWGEHWAAECPYGAGYGTIPYLFLTQHGWEAYVPSEDDVLKKRKLRERRAAPGGQTRIDRISQPFWQRLPGSVPAVIVGRKSNTLKVRGRNLTCDQLVFYHIHDKVDDEGEFIFAEPTRIRDSISSRKSEENKELYRIEPRDQKSSGLTVRVHADKHFKADEFKNRHLEVNRRPPLLAWLGPLGWLIELCISGTSARLYLGVKEPNGTRGNKIPLRLLWESPASYILHPGRHPVFFLITIAWLCFWAFIVPIHQIFAGIILCLQWPHSGFYNFSSPIFKWDPVIIPSFWFLSMVVIIALASRFSGVYAGYAKRFLLLLILTIWLAPSGIMAHGQGISTEAASIVLNRRFSRFDGSHNWVRKQWPFAVNHNWAAAYETSDIIKHRFNESHDGQSWFYALDDYDKRVPMQVEQLAEKKDWKQKGIVIQIKKLNDKNQNHYQEPKPGVIIRRGDVVRLYLADDTAVPVIIPAKPVPQLTGRYLSPQLLADYDKQIVVRNHYGRAFEDIGQIVRQSPPAGSKWMKGEVLTIWVARFKPEPKEKELLEYMNAAVHSKLPSPDFKKLVAGIHIEGPVAETLEEKPAPYGGASRWKVSYHADLTALRNNIKLFTFQVRCSGAAKVVQQKASETAREALGHHTRQEFFKGYQVEITKPDSGSAEDRARKETVFGISDTGESLQQQTDAILQLIDSLLQNPDS